MVDMDTDAIVAVELVSTEDLTDNSDATELLTAFRPVYNVAESHAEEQFEEEEQSELTDDEEDKDEEDDEDKASKHEENESL